MPTNHNIQRWIADFTKTDTPRAKSLVMTLFGDAIAPHGGKVWLGSLIALLAQFGVNDRLVRTSVFRLAEEGWLKATRHGRRSSYSLAPATGQRFQRAYRRIYTPLHPHWDGNWTLVLAPPDELGVAARSRFRKEMLWQGYGLVSPGVFAHPSADREVLQEIIQRTGVERQLFVCSASDLSAIGGRPLSDLIATAWELESVNGSYRQFISRFAPLLPLLQGRAIDGPAAFMIRSLLIHNFRRALLHDPQLPVELLPASWAGTEAYALCHQLYQACYAPAEDYLMRTLSLEEPDVPPAASYFHTRFGGLK